MCKRPGWPGDRKTTPQPISAVDSLQQKIARLEKELEEAKQEKLKIQRDLLLVPSIHRRMKAGCIGEFTITTQQVCPECWNRDEEDRDEECEFCDNKSDEHCLVDVEVDVPWTTQKEIFKRMCHFKFEALKNGEDD